MEAHNLKVAVIAKKVLSFFDRNEPFRISHGSTNSTRPRREEKVVDISSLSSIVEINVEARTVLVEPNVPMDKLVAATLEHNLVPPVVVEFPGITAGGAFAGTAGESSSFKFGLFDRTVNRVEILLGNSRLVYASKEENSELFHGASGALGTLGITTLLELRLIEAKKYVRVTYHPRNTITATIDCIQDRTSEPENDFVDGILFSENHGVVIVGQMTNDEPGARPQTFSYPWDPWFYLHVRNKTLRAAVPAVDYVPLPEYLFRYDRGGFWIGRAIFQYFLLPFNRLTRWLLDDLLKTRMLYKGLHASHLPGSFIIQDLAVPYSSARGFLDYLVETFGIWPIWLCPLKVPSTPSFHPNLAAMSQTGAGQRTAPGSMLSIGLWGPGSLDGQRCVAMNRDLEHRLREFGGMKWLYAHAFYPESEFWEIYDRPAYEALREKYHATRLPTVYDKVKVDFESAMQEVRESWAAWAISLWPIGGIWGVWSALGSGAYLPRCPPWRTS